MLKLKVETLEDLKILSACVQDAKFQLNEVTFLEDSKSFILMLDRYCWEQENLENNDFFRSASALHIESAEAYQLLIEKEKAQDFVFEILSIHFKDKSIFLHCVDQSVISVETSGLQLFLRDIGEPKKVDTRPKHSEVE